MKRILIFSISLFLYSGLSSQPNYKLSEKEAFTIGYPQFYAFRGENSGLMHKDYEKWLGYLKNTSGVNRDFRTKEITIHPKSAEFVNKYLAANSSKLGLLHFNTEARHALRDPIILDRHFPGHWLYTKGADVEKVVARSKSYSEFEISDVDPFVKMYYLAQGPRLRLLVDKEGKYEYEGKYNPGERKLTYKKKETPFYVLIVKLDDKGNRLWYESEIAKITKLDTKSKTLSTETVRYTTDPVNMTSGKVYIAPFTLSFWTKDPMFFYNMSSFCPKDKNGKNAADVFSEETAGLFLPNGELHNMNGLSLDVNYFDVATRLPLADVNNDGITDGGWVDGINSWMIGDYYFLKTLRKHMGDNAILVCDGWSAENQQAVGVLNGLESEGLVSWNDGWRGISKAINTHVYWHENNPLKYKYSFVVTKLRNPADAKQELKLRRFAIATATILGAYSTLSLRDDITKILPEHVQSPGSLGNIKSDLIHYPKLFPEIYSKSGAELLPNITSSDAVFSNKGDALEIAAKQKHSGKYLNLTIKDVELPEGDVTIFVETQSLEPLEGLTASDWVPRVFYLTIDGLPDYGEGRYNKFYSDLYGMIGTKRPEELSFYFRDLPQKTNHDIDIKIQGRGKVLIKSIKIYNKSDVLIREYDNGVVVVNPSLHKQEIDISPITRKTKDKKIAVDPLDAAFVL